MRKNNYGIYKDKFGEDRVTSAFAKFGDGKTGMRGYGKRGGFLEKPAVGVYMFRDESAEPWDTLSPNEVSVAEDTAKVVVEFDSVRSIDNLIYLLQEAKERLISYQKSE